MQIMAENRRPVTLRCGLRIRALRQREGLTLEALAQRTGYAKGTLSKIENGKGDPPLETLDRIAEALRVTVRDFFQDDEGRPLFAGLPIDVALIRALLASLQDPYMPMLGVI
jgi:transcriptional regulator with XRE-family HTH domain